MADIRKKIRKFLLVVLVIAILIWSLPYYARFSISPDRLVVQEISLPCDQNTETMNGLKIVFFSDTHIGQYFDAAMLEKVAQRINDLTPDMVIFGGDLFESYQDYQGHNEEIIAVLSNIQAKYGKYAVFGNHDQGGGAYRIYEDMMEAGGVRVLVNEAFVPEGLPCNIIGLDDFLLGSGDISLVPDLVRQDCFNLLLCHEPDVVDGLSENDIGLVLAGHTHGGQIRLPFWGALSLPPLGEKYVTGLYSKEGMPPLLVTQGVGVTKVPLRILTPPEIVLIQLEGEKTE